MPYVLMYVLEATNGLETIVNIFPTLLELLGTLITFMFANPLLALILAGSVAGMLIGIFGKMKRSVKK